MSFVFPSGLFSSTLYVIWYYLCLCYTSLAIIKEKQNKHIADMHGTQMQNACEAGATTALVSGGLGRPPKQVQLDPLRSKRIRKVKLHSFLCSF